jgi:hypothetical protein
MVLARVHIHDQLSADTERRAHHTASYAPADRAEALY